MVRWVLTWVYFIYLCSRYGCCIEQRLNVWSEAAGSFLGSEWEWWSLFTWLFRPYLCWFSNGFEHILVRTGLPINKAMSYLFYSMITIYNIKYNFRLLFRHLRLQTRGLGSYVTDTLEICLPNWRQTFFVKIVVYMHIWKTMYRNGLERGAILTNTSNHHSMLTADASCLWMCAYKLRHLSQLYNIQLPTGQH